MNRRRAMMGLGLATAAPVILAGAAKAANAPDRSAWDQALRAYEKAKAEDEAFDRIFNPIYDQRLAAIDALPVKPLPNDPYVGRYDPAIDGQYRLQCIVSARRTVEEWDAGKVRVEDYIRDQYERHIAARREVVAIDDEHRAAVRQIEENLGYGPAEERWERLGELRWEAERKLLCDVPAPDTEALLFKLERLEAGERGLHDWEDVMADARRILSGGRA